jgi:hypothetical protein
MVDHQTLLYSSKGQEDLTSICQQIMMLNLLDFDLEALYRNGEHHVDADSLSRSLRFETFERKTLSAKARDAGRCHMV